MRSWVNGRPFGGQISIRKLISTPDTTSVLSEVHQGFTEWQNQWLGKPKSTYRLNAKVSMDINQKANSAVHMFTLFQQAAWVSQFTNPKSTAALILK